MSNFDRSRPKAPAPSGGPRRRYQHPNRSNRSQAPHFQRPLADSYQSPRIRRTEVLLGCAAQSLHSYTPGHQPCSHWCTECCVWFAAIPLDHERSRITASPQTAGPRRTSKPNFRSWDSTCSPSSLAAARDPKNLCAVKTVNCAGSE